MTKNKTIRVVIAEDSAAYRDLIISILQNTDDVEVVGVAKNGAEAVRLVHRLEPDLIIMDIHMPQMNGFDAARHIMQESPRPIVMVSASLQVNEHNLTFDALQAGALSIINKPTLFDPPEAYESLVAEIKTMAEVRVVRRWQRQAKASPPVPVSLKKPDTLEIIAIASSTGGPAALAEILSRLPGTLPVPILVVQHITIGFGASLAEWLNQQTPLEVKLARLGDIPKAGQVLIAPDNYHMTVNTDRSIGLHQKPPYRGLRPAADYLFFTMADVYRAKAIGVILTGMGDDGAKGLQAMHNQGAYTIAQNQDTCVVFGMPAAAITLGAATSVQPLGNIASTLIQVLKENVHDSS